MKQGIKEDKFTWFNCARMHNLYQLEKPTERVLLIIQEEIIQQLQRRL